MYFVKIRVLWRLASKFYKSLHNIVYDRYTLKFNFTQSKKPVYTSFCNLKIPILTFTKLASLYLCGFTEILYDTRMIPTVPTTDSKIP